MKSSKIKSLLFVHCPLFHLAEIVLCSLEINGPKSHCLLKDLEKWYFVTKIVRPTVRKCCSSDREKLLKFKAEGREFSNFLRSQEQFIQTVKGQNNFW